MLWINKTSSISPQWIWTSQTKKIVSEIKDISLEAFRNLCFRKQRKNQKISLNTSRIVRLPKILKENF